MTGTAAAVPVLMLLARGKFRQTDRRENLLRWLCFTASPLRAQCSITTEGGDYVASDLVHRYWFHRRLDRQSHSSRRRSYGFLDDLRDRHWRVAAGRPDRHDREQAGHRGHVSSGRIFPVDRGGRGPAVLRW